jgi:hypothetical protein
MRSMIRSIRIYLYNKVFTTLGKLVRNFYILAIKQGQKRSLEQKSSVNAKGEPIPWFTYPAIEFLNRFDFSQIDIFEFGSGNSTLFWGSKAKNTISIEHNPEWFHCIKRYVTNKLKIYLKQKKAQYIGSLREFNKLFDIIIIDGKWRHACSQLAPDYLKDGGLIIFDNSDWFPNATKYLRDKGFFQIDFSGFGPINDYCSTTSIFLKANIRIQKNYVQLLPIGGINKTIGKDDDDFV